MQEHLDEDHGQDASTFIACGDCHTEIHSKNSAAVVTGKPDARKRACPVREEGVGEGTVPHHPDRAHALLQEAGTVGDQYSVWVAQLLQQLETHVIADGVGIPHRRTQQPLGHYVTRCPHKHRC